MARLFDYITNKGSLISETGVLGVITGALSFTKSNKGYYLQCTGSKYITFTLPSLAQKSIITVTKVNNNYTVTQTNTTATITSLVLNNANYLRYIIYDSVASATADLKNIQAWINTLQPLTYQKRQLSLSKPTELKQSGLIAAYNMKPVGNILHDISGNGNNGTISGGLQTVKGIVFDGINDRISRAAFTDVSTTKKFTICMRLKPNNITSSQQLVVNANSGTDRCGIVITTNTIGIETYNGAYKAVNGVTTNKTINTFVGICDNNTLSAYLNGVLVIGTSTTGNLGNTFTGFAIGSAATPTNFYNGEIYDIRIYNRILTTQEIKAYHNSFNEVLLHEKFEDMAVGSSKLPNGWIKNGGSFICAESTVNDPVIKSIRKGTKYLRCVTVGIVAIPCKWVNGTIKNNIYKAGNTVNDWLFTSTVIGAFNTTGQNGYLLRWDTDNKFKLYKITNGVLSAALITSVNTYPPSWYEPTVTRTTSGVFTVYINGVSIGTTTDTTYNSSNYFVMDLDANDRVTDILIQLQIK